MNSTVLTSLFEVRPGRKQSIWEYLKHWVRINLSKHILGNDERAVWKFFLRLPRVQCSGLSASTAGVPSFSPWSESYDPASHMVWPKKFKNSPRWCSTGMLTSSKIRMGVKRLTLEAPTWRWPVSRLCCRHSCEYFPLLQWAPARSSVEVWEAAS